MARHEDVGGGVGGEVECPPQGQSTMWGGLLCHGNEDCVLNNQPSRGNQRLKICCKCQNTDTQHGTNENKNKYKNTTWRTKGGKLICGQNSSRQTRPQEQSRHNPAPKNNNNNSNDKTYTNQTVGDCPTKKQKLNTNNCNSTRTSEPGPDLVSDTRITDRLVALMMDQSIPRLNEIDAEIASVVNRALFQ